MKKRYLFLGGLLGIICIFLFYFYVKNDNTYENYNEYKKRNNLNSGMLSIMLETEAKSGIYEMSKESTWPTKGYKFNAELSKCDNGGELSWDNDKKVVLMSADSINNCYVYFDLNSQTLAEYVMSQYTGVQGENAMYYHDSTLANGANDNNYRYAGPSEEVNNFVCFGSNAAVCPTDNLYRIIGVFGENYHGVSGEQLVKLIKYDYANSNLLGTDGDYYGLGITDISNYKGELVSINTYRWNFNGATSNATNTWSTSLLNKTNLNTNFLNNIDAAWSDKIVTITWKVGGNTYKNMGQQIPSVAYQNEIINPDAINSTDNAIEYKAKMGLMYVSDYGFSASPSVWTLTMINYDNITATNNNWMYMGIDEWTISRNANYNGIAFLVHNGGGIRGNVIDGGGGGVVYNTNLAIRLSFFLSSSSMYQSGIGTKEDPIRVE